MADWRAKAACRGLETTLFFPDRPDTGDDAKAVCRSCCVRQDCFEYMLGLPFTDIRGVWAGFSGRDRRRIGKIRLMKEGIKAIAN